MDLVRRITESEVRKPISRWTGNDTSGRWHTGKLNASSERDFVLFWRESARSRAQFIGCFRLQLNRLVEEGYCKEENGKIRVTFYHEASGEIVLKIRRFDTRSQRIDSTKREGARL